MQKNSWTGRMALLIVVVGAAVYTLAPSYFYYFQRTPEQRADYQAFCESLPAGLPCKKVNLGLDLQGGLHLVLGVDVDRAIETRLDSIVASLKRRSEDAKAQFGGGVPKGAELPAEARALVDAKIERPRGAHHIEITLASGASSAEFDRYIRSDDVLVNTSRADGLYKFELIPEEDAAIRARTVDQTLDTLRRRADEQELGVTDPDIRRRPDSNQIILQMPGVEDEEYAIQVLQTTAQLEFTMVDVPGSSALNELALPPGVTRRSVQTNRGVWTYLALTEAPKASGKGFETTLREELLVAANEVLPTDRKLLFGVSSPNDGEERRDGEGAFYGYYLEQTPGITGDYIKDVQLIRPGSGVQDIRPSVSITFDAQGADIFGRVTEANVNRYMAIVLDDVVRSAPVINERIPNGQASITMGYGAAALQEASVLRDVLTSGALPAPIELLNRKKVGKTLGDYAISAGIKAISIGAVLVVFFMLFYYRGSGLIANLALLLNVVLVMAAMAAANTTLTLPGIAGIVLTIGMAVDANIIIFERIREELRAGKSARGAIDAGYGRAFRTILDANITTLIAAIVLLQYGSGPVKGFANTLWIGIATSMFTAIFVTRLLMNVWSSRSSFKALSI